MEKRVSSKTVPAFLWHTWEDDAVPVENSLQFAMALRKEQIPFELHIYEKGGHGLFCAMVQWMTVCGNFQKKMQSGSIWRFSGFGGCKTSDKI